MKFLMSVLIYLFAGERVYPVSNQLSQLELLNTPTASFLIAILETTKLCANKTISFR